jgi:hypothetical protein
MGQLIRKNWINSDLLFLVILVFFVSASTLILQLIQTRIYSVVFWNHLVYFIISIALLGFGISGTWLSFGKNTFIARMLSIKSASICFVLATLISSLYIPRFSFSLSSIFADFGHLTALLITYIFAILPYFFAGWILGTVFRDNAKNIHFLYFADLCGAGIGCLFYLLSVQYLGAIKLVIIICALVSMVPLINDFNRISSKILLPIILVLLLILNIFSDKINSKIKPEQTKASVALYQNLPPTEKTVELSEWNPISRIDVIASKQKPDERTDFMDSQACTRRIFIDGDAWTRITVLPELPLKPFDPDNEMMGANKSPYFFNRGEINSALVIGSGGGVDVLFALKGGAKQVDAIEINPTTWRIMVDEYRKITNNLMIRDNVHAFCEEGRSFIRRSNKKYDVIMMHAIDTFAAINAGAYVLSENYLYTTDAIEDYFSHLTDNGLLTITRWIHKAEVPRLFVVCLKALENLGIDDPEKHIILHLEYGSGVGGTVIVCHAPFSDEEIVAFRNHILRHNGLMLHPSDLTSTTKDPIHQVVKGYLLSRKDHTDEAFLSALDFDITPVDDDSPFFFHYDKVRDMLKVFKEKGAEDLIRGHWASFTLFSLLTLTLVGVFVFVFIPLMNKGCIKIPMFYSWITYFSCLGLSFIFVEIALMQRFALLLGHPSRSLALVLASLLFFAGLGSYLRGRLNINLIVSLTVLFLIILTAAFFYPFIIKASLGFSLLIRGLITIILVAPLGFFMGMPFPTGIRKVSEYNSDAVPWMWGVNGGSTVMGSVLAIILAIKFNFTTVFLVAATGYLFALLLHTKLWYKS